MAARKTSKKTLSKSDFIRTQPATLSAPEVVAKAKAAGIKFSHQLVYNVRGGDLKAKKGSAKKTGRSHEPARPTGASWVSRDGRAWGQRAPGERREGSCPAAGACPAW